MATYTLRYVEKKPLSFSLPVLAAAGGFAGLFVGAAQSTMLNGIAGGAVLLAVLGFLALGVLDERREKPVRWGVMALMAAGGWIMGGLAGLIVGIAFGWFFGWFVYWIGEGRYRAHLLPYLTPGQVLGHYAFRVTCGLIFFFLITPIVVVMPLSFNAENFFTFTPRMLALDPEGFSLKHYRDFFTNPDWQQALWNSVAIAPVATFLSVSFGTLAAIGLSSEHVPFRRAIMAVLISPMIVPLIISAAGMYFFYSRLGLQGTYWGVVLAHAALGIPFVIITVTATLVGFDRSLTRAAANLGANPVTTFFRVQMPLILPGVISGGLFAFITSFDEVVVVLFVGSAGQKTLPWQMFIGLREQISPTILAVATILVAISIVLLTTVEMLRRRSERLRGLSPG
ncbi:MAG: ABC transporter permease [Roseovarius sp.]|nr:ABC transporter permease [Roseovarius sp.]